MRSVPLIVALLLMFTGLTSQAAPRRAAAARKAPIDISQNIQNDFQNWDSNHDGQLDLRELNAAIEKPTVVGVDAAIAVAFRRRLNADIKRDEEVGSLTAAEAAVAANEVPFQRQVKSIEAHIHKVSRLLFLPTDPNLYTFHQGPVGDCYLMSVIGAVVFRDAKTIRSMIEPQPNGGFVVHFASGRNITIPPLTEGELVIGSPEGSSHGIWMGVLEQTWAQLTREVREKKTGKAVEDDEALDTDLIGHGGYAGPVIGQFTGHKASSASVGRWTRQDPNSVTNRMEKLLTSLTADHRIIVALTHAVNKKLPVPNHHFFAVLSYDASRHVVRMFNPWGNKHQPAGPPGLENGYVTEHGFFEVPIGEFLQIFGGVEYETQTPFKN
jgi:Calpain family cysteine protease